MDWLPVTFFVLAAWAVLTLVANERRRLIEAPINPAPAPAHPSAAPAAPAHH